MTANPKRLADLSPDAARTSRSQLRLAYEFEKHCADRFMFVSDIGWFFYNGVRWEESRRGEVEQAVMQMYADLWPAALADAGLQSDIKAGQSSSGLRGVLDLASKMPVFAVTVEDLDADPYLINVQNGTLDLMTATLRDHDPRDRITKVTRSSFDPNATGGNWDQFIERIVPDEDERAYLRRCVGLGLIGKVREHILVILLGPGGNGKSTFYEAVSFALGDYAMSAEPELFMHRDGAHPTGQMDLRGKRWVVVSETEQGKPLAAASVKRLTGGDLIVARRMHRDFVSFVPSHTAFMVTNHLPKVSGNDPALWRRIRVIRFDVVIPQDEQNGSLDDLLHAEADGIFSWMLAGWADYIARNYKMHEPPRVLEATAQYREESDDIARFIEERCFVQPGLRVKQKELRQAYDFWRSAESGVRQLSVRAFATEMQARGFNSVKGTANVAFFDGIALGEAGVLPFEKRE